MEGLNKNNEEEIKLTAEEEAMYQKIITKAPMTRKIFQEKRKELLTNKSDSNPATDEFSTAPDGLLNVTKDKYDTE